MSVLDTTLIILAGSIVAGFFGAMTGLGGGVIIVPMLTLAFSLVSFLRERDWMYTLFTSTALMLLLYSLVGRQVF